MNHNEKITHLLQVKDLKKQENQNELYNMVYDHLKGLAQNLLNREHSKHTFTASDLVNEGFLKLQNLNDIDWTNRSHFYKIAVRAMKQILIDHARAKSRHKRGAGAKPVALSEAEYLAVQEKSIDDLISLHDALYAYEQFDPKGRGKKIIEYVYFQGMTNNEIASELNVTLRTIQRDRKVAEAWLKRYFSKL